MESFMDKNTKITSADVATQAAQTLNNPNASKIAKSLAGSALAQRDPDKETGKIIENQASNVLRSNKYSDDTKSLAAAVLTQSNKDR
jgi:hypothetical protein